MEIAEPDIIEAKLNFSLDWEGLQHLRPDWFNDEGDFFATHDEIQQWLDSSEGKQRLIDYFAEDMKSILEEDEYTITNWEFLNRYNENA